MQLLEDFLGQKLTGTGFIESIKQEVERTSREQEPNYKTLSERLYRGEIIPFLGPDALNLSGIPVPSSKEIIRQMAAKVDWFDFSGTLPMISQYCLTEKDYSMGMIVDTVKEMLEKETESCSLCPFYELLGDIEKPLLLISSSYDQQLEKIFIEKEKKFVVVTHDIQSISGSDPARLILKYSDIPEPEKDCPGEELYRKKPLEQGYSLIYNICGCFGLLEEDPLLILENDFFAFSRRLEQLIPGYITGKFPQRGFLFLGYTLEEWQNRLIANALLEKRAHSSESCYTVWEAPGPYDLAFWKSHHVNILNVGLKEFALHLKEKIKQLNFNREVTRRDAKIGR